MSAELVGRGKHLIDRVLHSVGEFKFEVHEHEHVELAILSQFVDVNGKTITSVGHGTSRELAKSDWARQAKFDLDALLALASKGRYRINIFVARVVIAGRPSPRQLAQFMVDKEIEDYGVNESIKSRLN